MPMQPARKTNAIMLIAITPLRIFIFLCSQSRVKKLFLYPQKVVKMGLGVKTNLASMLLTRKLPGLVTPDLSGSHVLPGTFFQRESLLLLMNR
jgi:hypothetical protein